MTTHPHARADYDRLQKGLYAVVTANGCEIDVGVALLALMAVSGSLIAQAPAHLRDGLLADARKWIGVARQSVERTEGEIVRSALPCPCRRCRIRSAIDGPSAEGDGAEARMIDVGVATAKFVSKQPVEEREKLQGHLIASFLFTLNTLRAPPGSTPDKRVLM